MKYVKVTITKNRTEKQTSFKYPKGYDVNKFNIVCYQNEGLDLEFAIATIDDTFITSEGLEEISLGQAKQFIDDFIKLDKDIKDDILVTKGIDRVSFIKDKQKYLGK